MFHGLFGRKSAPRAASREREVPLYAAIAERPTRGLPDALSARERSESFAAARATCERSLLDAPPRAEDQPTYATLVSRRGGLVTLDGGSEAPRVALLFSSRIRAFDYRDEMGCPRDVEVLVLTQTALLRMARDIEGAGISQFTLDRCPRCDHFVAYAVSVLTTVEQAWRLRCVHKATEAARLRLYVEAARDAARGGRLLEARDIALETAAHVTLEDPTLHLLLGNLGVALGDASLAADAVRMLRLLGASRQAARLGAAIASGASDLEGLFE